MLKMAPDFPECILNDSMNRQGCNHRGLLTAPPANNKQASWCWEKEDPAKAGVMMMNAQKFK
jgi:hypothetical protein